MFRTRSRDAYAQCVHAYERYCSGRIDDFDVLARLLLANKHFVISECSNLITFSFATGWEEVVDTTSYRMNRAQQKEAQVTAESRHCLACHFRCRSVPEGFPRTSIMQTVLAADKHKFFKNTQKRRYEVDPDAFYFGTGYSKIYRCVSYIISS